MGKKLQTKNPSIVRLWHVHIQIGVSRNDGNEKKNKDNVMLEDVGS
jgi:hypothetical protein